MNKIFVCSYGSKLYGTNLPESDDDRKGIFMSSIEDIILGSDKETILETNKEKGIDYEFKELRRFLYDALKGQTYALELLFVPKQFWIKDYWSDFYTWDEILKNRDKIISKSVMPFLGFAIGQAQKYSLKGQKYNHLGHIIAWVNEVDANNNGIFTKDAFWKVANIRGNDFQEELQCKSIVFEKDNKGLNMTNFLGKKFYDNVTCKEVLKTLNAFKSRYGDRATKAASLGEIDWKAYYHSVRLLDEVSELLDTGFITLPRPDVKHLLDIRLGKVSYEDLVAEIDEKVEIARKKQETSSLPDTADKEFWDNFIINVYLNEYKYSQDRNPIT